MVSTLQIMCVGKTNRQSVHARISHLGGVNGDDVHWRLSIDEAIEGAESRRLKFYINVKGQSHWIVVATSYLGIKYLKTKIDGDQPNKLLSLPESQ